MYAEWPWNGKYFEERAIYLVHPEEYLISCANELDTNQREAIEMACGQAMAATMPIISPQAPFRCTIPFMTISCRKKIAKEFYLAQRSIGLAKARYPDLSWKS